MTPSALLAAQASRSRQDPQHPGFPTTFTLRAGEIVPYTATERVVFWSIPPNGPLAASKHTRPRPRRPGKRERG